MTTAEELRSLARLGQAMRQKQNDYFKRGRSSADLADSKALEREFDKRCSEILAGPSLFDGGKAG